MDLKRQLEVVQKRLNNVYERDSHYELGEIINWILCSNDGCTSISRNMT